ncbi:MAG: type 1 glutamine amidotransferase [Streptosporangiales bacterium]|nr:type 1 glutamine amidotransferase [Streptosporangiales bacterium]
MTDIAVIAHIAEPDIRWITIVLDRHATTWALLRPVLGDDLPSPDTVRGVICIGGPQSANAPDPVLGAEQEFLSTAVGNELPVMGICLGSQLLARALGGSVYPCPDGPEYGYIDITATGADATLTPGTRAHLAFHGETFDVPPGAIPLAASRRFLQAYRMGTALGIQFHPEMSPAGVRAAATHDAARIRAAGIDPKELVAESERRADTAFRLLDDLVSRWLGNEVWPSTSRNRHTSTRR